MMELTETSALERHPHGGVLVEVVDEHILLMTVDRVEKKNAFTPKIVNELSAALTRLDDDPDLFVGVSGLPLLVDGAWVDELVIDLRPYDGGTRSDVDFTMNGALQEPPLPIAVVDSFEDHLIGPGSLGTMTFVRVDDGA